MRPAVEGLRELDVLGAPTATPAPPSRHGGTDDGDRDRAGVPDGRHELLAWRHQLPVDDLVLDGHSSVTAHRGTVARCDGCSDFPWRWEEVLSKDLPLEQTHALAHHGDGKLFIEPFPQLTDVFARVSSVLQ